MVREFFDDWLAAERSLCASTVLDGSVPRARAQRRRVAAEFDVIGDWVLEGGVRYWIERSIPLAADAKNSFLPDLYRADTKLP